MLDKWTRYCQEVLDNPNWYPWYFEAVQGGLLCKGAECPLITRGENKGQPNFRKKDLSTVDKVIIPAGVLK